MNTNRQVNLMKKQKLSRFRIRTSKLLLGKTDVEGEGIEVTLREKEDDEIARINADDLLLIVNAL